MQKNDAVDGPSTLRPVHAVIPKECYANPAWKGLLYIARDFAMYAALLVALAATDRWYLLLPLWFFAALIISALFILGHDAAHGSLFASRHMNQLFGRLLFLPSLHVFESWVFGHNRLHHGHTVRQGADFVWHPLTVEDWHKLGPLARLLVRVEWSCVGSGLYYARNIWSNMMRLKQPPSMAKKIHRDQALVYAFIVLAGAAFAAFGWLHYGTALGAAWAVTKMLVIPSAAFLHAIGLAVYLHHIDSEIQWWPRGRWDKFKGQMEGTTIMTVPAWVDVFLHQIMIHVPHHVDMRIPFYNLTKAADAIVAAFPDVVRVERLSLFAYARTTRACKLYDFTTCAWSGYPKGVAPIVPIAPAPAAPLA